MKKTKLKNLIIMILSLFIVLGVFVGVSYAYFKDVKHYEGQGVLPPSTTGVVYYIDRLV